MKKIFVIIIFILLIISIYLLYVFNYIPHQRYYNSDFNIDTYISTVDMDNDGINDQEDILNNAYKYINTKPKYKSKYYSTGYSDDEYGVCTDVIGYALLNSGYDLMNLVNEDIINNRNNYDIDKIDKNIDFRRVRNLLVYFKNNSISLTTDINKIMEWQGGDIVIFKNHIGIISNTRNKKGIPFVIHHYSKKQAYYEEDILGYWGDILGHFRIS